MNQFYADTKARQSTTRKLYINTPHELRCKNPQQNINKSNLETYIVTYHEQIGLIPGMQS